MRLYTVTGLMTALIISGCAVTQPPKGDEDHSTQHPEGSATATTTIKAAPIPTPSAEAFNRQMQAMEAMHKKMQAARTPAKRAALLGEQTKLMQSGMAMMSQMRSATPAGAEGIPAMGDMMSMHMQMERRMAMMEKMMQMMMVEHLPTPAPTGTKRPKNSK